MRSKTIQILSEQRFCQLLINISPLLATTASTIWHNLQTAYQQPHRRYHTLQHITECLQLFDSYQHLAVQPLLVEFALWLHDAVYQPQRFDNEQQSAFWATQILQQGQIESTIIEKVYQLIMATGHRLPPQSNDEKLLVDIDLGIFATSPARFAQYQKQIRAEYFWVAESIYQQKRKEILIRLYNNGDIYHCAELKLALEAAACINLKSVYEI